MLERRRHARRVVNDAVIVHRGRRMDATRAIDLSLGGILVEGPGDLELGEHVVIAIDGTERPATVVRVTPAGLRALVFD